MCLVRGGREKKLQGLKAGPQPTQATGVHIWWLLQKKISPAQLNAGLHLLLDAPLATASTEHEAHTRGGGLVKRMHHEIGQHALVARAMMFWVHQFIAISDPGGECGREVEGRACQVGAEGPGQSAGQAYALQGYDAAFQRVASSRAQAARGGQDQTDHGEA